MYLRKYSLNHKGDDDEGYDDEGDDDNGQKKSSKIDNSSDTKTYVFNFISHWLRNFDSFICCIYYQITE